MKITILGFDRAFSSSITCLMDIFRQAELFLSQSTQPSICKEITTELVSIDGKPIRCQNSVVLDVSGAAYDITKTDIIIVTSIHSYNDIRKKYQNLADWLFEQSKKGTSLASFCTGAFLIAETKLLDGKDATTHWSAFEAFKQSYPNVRLQTKKMIIDQNNIYCSGGNSGSMDLAFYLIEKFLGHSLAVKTAKFMHHDLRRVSQRAYSVYDPITDHIDIQIKKVQTWITGHLTEPITNYELLGIAHMSLRTFERRFKKATGDSPMTYIQKLRTEKAKELLETTNMSFDEISYQMGYKNSGSFRKIFVKWVSLLPSEYRKRFQAYI